MNAHFRSFLHRLFDGFFRRLALITKVCQSRNGIVKDLITRITTQRNPNANAVIGLGLQESMFGGMSATISGGDKLKIRISQNFGLLIGFFGARADATFQAIPAAAAAPAPVAKPAKAVKD